MEMDVEQRSDEWYALRMGRITASHFGDILAEPRSAADREAGNLSASAETYMLTLLAEHLTGTRYSIHVNEAMRHGIQWEDDARRVYEEVTGNPVRQIGFVVSDDLEGVGCSPDGLVGDVGGLEIKCPFNAHEHLRNVPALAVPTKYVAQMQGSMWICEREWWDFVSYDPRQEHVGLAFARVRLKRDDEFIKRLHRASKRVIDKLGVEIKNAAKLTKKSVECEAHRVARLCVEPITLRYENEEIRV